MNRLFKEGRDSQRFLADSRGIYPLPLLISEEVWVIGCLQ